MNLLTALITLLTICACTKKSNYVPLVPPEYQISESNLKNGKICVYLNQRTGERSTRTLVPYHQNGKKYLILTSYIENKPTDSLIYLDHKLIENYSYIFGPNEIIKAEILFDTVIQTKRKIGKEISEYDFRDNYSSLLIHQETEYANDTIMDWQGKKVDAIIITSNTKCKYKNKSHSEADKEFTIELTSYFAKGLGEIKSIIKGKNDQITIVDLIEIKDYKN